MRYGIDCATRIGEHWWIVGPLSARLLTTGPDAGGYHARRGSESPGGERESSSSPPPIRPSSCPTSERGGWSPDSPRRSRPRGAWRPTSARRSRPVAMV